MKKQVGIGRDGTSRRFALQALSALGVGTLLPGCGGGGSSSSDASLRVVNALVSRNAIDVYEGSTLLFSGIAGGDASEGKDVGTTSLKFNVRTAGSSVNNLEQTVSLNQDHRTTVILTGPDSALGLGTFVENEDDPDGGYAKLRLINTLQTGDALDLYLTANVDDLSSQSPVLSNLGKGGTSGFRSLSKGTYRLRVTTSGDKNEVRLDIAQFVVGDKQVLTFLATPTGSGTLANGLSLVQGGSATRYANTSGRVRFANGMSASVQVAVDGTPVANVGGWGASSYVSVGQGSRTFVFTSGSQTYSQQVDVTGGADMTIAIASQNGAISAASSKDDNLPSTTSTRFRMRLVNLAEGIGSAQLTFNSGTIIADYTAAGQFSAYREFTAGEYDFKVTAGSLASTLSSQTVASGAVYTAFLFGSGSIASFALIRDR